ncbi:hypothetical protein [Thermococcus pacificus]|uniref:Uncharacterized protein n=1 Tax=Thermococcus pacificus TaxID=71998 RepID=A0A218P9C3_9EURY|nr:hypothetical protein [Thermococcus pacificus]ASJ07392.1 hypothetical protein A3L08_08710 [Thermococcus pacificus]
MSRRIIVWYEYAEGTVKLALQEHALALNKNGYELIIPVNSKTILEGLNDNIEKKLEEFYLEGHGEIVLIVSPQGDMIGYMFLEEELQQLTQRVSASHSFKKPLQDVLSVTEDVENPLPAL